MSITITLLCVIVFLLVCLIYISITRSKNNLGADIESLLKHQPDLMQAKFSESLAKNNNVVSKDLHELKEDILFRLAHSSEKLNKDLFEFKDDFSEKQKNSFSILSQTVEERLEKISKKVKENLDEGFKKTNETFNNVLIRLAKIDEAQKKIESLSSDVVSLQDVLTDKKSRGIFGEVQLHHVLASVFGDVNNKVYKLQYSLSNSKIVDAILFLPEPMGRVCVDSKFPLENYKRMFDKTLSDEQRQTAMKEFGKNVKKHIDDISSKYILKDETADQAIMFLPAEAIFAELHAYHQDVVEYANTKKVWLTSPTTFLATLTTVQSVLTNIERNKYMTIMHQEINKLGEDFERYQTRWDDLSKHLKTVTKDVDKIHTTSNKISNRFQKIMEVEIEHKDMIETGSNTELL
jgi:DNA recombination protein RmuC